jgi:hypothetical protein
LTSLGCQDQKGYLKRFSDDSFHIFRLSCASAFESSVSFGEKLERKIQYRPTISGSELEDVPVPDLNQRTEKEAASQETETAGFSTPKAKK